MRNKWVNKRQSVSFSEYELTILEEYCNKYGREVTDVIRELVRSLKDK